MPRKHYCQGAWTTLGRKPAPASAGRQLVQPPPTCTAPAGPPHRTAGAPRSRGTRARGTGTQAPSASPAAGARTGAWRMTLGRGSRVVAGAPPGDDCWMSAAYVPTDRACCQPGCQPLCLAASRPQLVTRPQGPLLRRCQACPLHPPMTASGVVHQCGTSSVASGQRSPGRTHTRTPGQRSLGVVRLTRAGHDWWHRPGQRPSGRAHARFSRVE